MKLFLCVGFLTVLAQLASAKLDLPPEMKEMIANLESTCEGESGVDPALVAGAKEKRELTPDPKMKCFLKCMMTNLQLMGEDGTFNRDEAVGNIPEELKAEGAVAVVDKCKDSKGSDPCDTAYQLITCFIKEAADMADVLT